MTRLILGYAKYRQTNTYPTNAYIPTHMHAPAVSVTVRVTHLTVDSLGQSC